MRLDIDLTADSDGYGYPALITTPARVHELASRILRTYLEDHYSLDKGASRPEHGVTLVDWDTNDEMPNSYTVSAQMWAGELGYYLSTYPTLDVLDELESVDRADEHLASVLERNTWASPYGADEEASFVSPGQVMAGVRALLTDPLIARVAGRRDLSHVRVDLDIDALVNGRPSVRSTHVTTDAGTGSSSQEPRPVSRSRRDDRRRGHDSRGLNRHI